jgi:hypothetical protein
MMKYARVLLGHCPDTTTQVFIEYYTGRYRPHQDINVSETPQPGMSYAASAANATANAVQNLTSLLPLPYLTPSTNQSPREQPAEEQLDGKGPPSYAIPSPRTVFSAFVSHPDCFVTFLEAVLAASPDASNESDLKPTLLEMYLSMAALPSTSAIEAESLRAKAEALITTPESGAAIPSSTVLLLSHMANYSTGTTLMRERAALYLDIFRSHTSCGDTAGAIKCLHRYGAIHPDLYTAALTYFVSSARVLDEAGPNLGIVLDKVAELGLLAPLQVVQLLGSTSAATMGVLNEYLRKVLDRETRQLAIDQRQIAAFSKETEEARRELEELSTKPRIVQQGRCAACGATMDLPAVHFACRHSFHDKCLNLGAGDGKGAECVVCRAGNETVRAMRRARDEAADRGDVFMDALAKSGDRFGTIGEWFGRGVMLGGLEGGL